jgi:hypothetical protein
MTKEIISDNSTTETSAFLIYNALRNSEHPLINKFKISFPYEGVLVEESNVIIVAEANEEFDHSTSHSDHYTALTEIYIKTKKADYEKVSKLLRSTRRAIKNVLKTDNVLKNTNMVFRNSACKYGNKFALKASNMFVQIDEVDVYNRDDEEDFSIFFEDTEID